MVDVIEETKKEMKKFIRMKYPGKQEIFYRVADEIVDTFGWAFPLDVEELIEGIAQMF